MSATGQTSVSYAPGYRVEGMVSRNAPLLSEQKISRLAEAAVKPGRFVIGGTDPTTQCTVVGASGDVTAKILGVVLWDPAQEPGTSYAAGTMVTIVKRGVVWMKAEDAVTFGNSPYIRYTVNGALDVGRVRSDADTSKAAVAANCRFLNATSGSDGWVEVEINIP